MRVFTTGDAQSCATGMQFPELKRCLIAILGSETQMKSRSWIGTFLVLLFALSTWAAEGSQATPDSGSFLLYVGLFNGQGVNVYKGSGHGTPAVKLVDGLQNIVGGIAVDQAQHVYIVTGGGTVVVYPRG